MFVVLGLMGIAISALMIDDATDDGTAHQNDALPETDLPIVTLDAVLNIGDGDNVIFAGHGDDLVQTGAGNDYINGEDGDDYLIGGAGNDTLHGG
ncbi:calcium-binding protein, partial [Yoonia sp.]|uniref:calcium-binding protein n=1 Tax=Yoonia sp. TaxID=2212373 RepID=UPI00345C5104